MRDEWLLHIAATVTLPTEQHDMRDTSIIKAVLGPTNTGKTHLAIERMLAHRTGVIPYLESTRSPFLNLLFAVSVGLRAEIYLGEAERS